MHWSDAYIGREYIPGTMDCAVLAETVSREVFGRDVMLPGERAHGLRGLTAQIEALKDDLAEPVTAPEDGDAVLMIGRGSLDHIGVYCLIDGVPYVLHAMRNAGQVVRHRLRELGGLGLRVEGYYRFK